MCRLRKDNLMQDAARKALEAALGEKKDAFSKWDEEIKKVAVAVEGEGEAGGAEEAVEGVEAVILVGVAYHECPAIPGTKRSRWFWLLWD
jgi:hypothetical protein